MSNRENLPEIKITTAPFPAADYRCVVCRREWEPGQTPVPSAYTVESIEADLPPQVVCDYCVEEHYPEAFAELLEDRERFWSS